MDGALAKIDSLAATLAKDVMAVEQQTANLAAGHTLAIQERVIHLRSRLAAQPVASASAPTETAETTGVPAPTTNLPAPAIGMDRHTGGKLDKAAHIRQSLMDIWTTPIGSRVMNREYGSKIPALVDAPLNESTLLRVLHAAAESALRWEPRIVKLLAVIPEVSAGHLMLGILAEDEDGNPIELVEAVA